MASNISEEEFLRLQEQLIALRTENYSLEEKCAVLNANNKLLLSQMEGLEKECGRAQTMLHLVRKSKNSDLIKQNESLQAKLQAQEDEFRLQNQTLLQEISALTAQNKELSSVFNLTADEIEFSIGANEKVKKLKAEADALQRALSEERLRSAQELAKLKVVIAENIDSARLATVLSAVGLDRDMLLPEAGPTETSSETGEAAAASVSDWSADEGAESAEKNDQYIDFISSSWEETQQELEEAREKVEKLETDFASEAMTLKTLREKYDHLERNYLELDHLHAEYKSESIQKINELEERLRVMMAETEKLTGLIRNYEYKMKELESEEARLGKELSECLMESEVVHSQLIQSNKEIDEIKARNRSLEKENYELSMAVGDTELALEATRTDIEILSDSNKRALCEYEGKIHHLENEKNQLEYKCKELKEIIESLKSSLKLSEMQKLNGEVKIKEVEQQLVDLAAERVLSEKKGAVVCRDLKRQLASERRRLEKVQERLRELDTTHSKLDGAKSIDVETASNSSWSLMSGNNDPQETSTRESSLVAGSPTNTNGNAYPQSEELDLELENRNLLERLTTLQEEKWALEEKLNNLERGNAAMAEDLALKSQMIKYYCMEGRSDPQTSTSSGKKAVKKLSDFLKSSDEEHIQECNMRMQRMLEEVLTKNMYLQRDMEQMSQAMEKLKTED